MQSISAGQCLHVSWLRQPVGLSLTLVSDKQPPRGQLCHYFPHVNKHLSTPALGQALETRCESHQLCPALE